MKKKSSECKLKIRSVSYLVDSDAKLDWVEAWINLAKKELLQDDKTVDKQ